MFASKDRSQEGAIPEAIPSERQSHGRLVLTIANGIKITGMIEADGAEVQIDGEVEGDVLGRWVTIGDTGIVKGGIVSENVTVKGHVEGSVRARNLVLASSSHVLGDIVHRSLSAEVGAEFEGQCHYQEDPLGQSGAQALSNRIPFGRRYSAQS